MTTNQEPLLSVIIPTYNRASFLPTVIGSLRASGVSDFEAVVVDDGSTDDTARVAATLGDNVSYHRQPNSGCAAARNRGLELSQGRYVCFLDSDDQWFPGVAPQMLDLLERNPDVGVAFTDARVGNHQEGYESLRKRNNFTALDDCPYREPDPGFRVYQRLPFFRGMVQKNLVFLGTAIMRRELVTRAGGFDVELAGAADWELCQRLANDAVFGFWHEPLSIWYQHPGCMSHNGDHMSEDCCLALEKVREKCTSLQPAERRLVDGRLRYLRFGHAYTAYDRGDYRAARRRFGELLRRCGFEFRSALFWGLCCLPFGLARRLRSLKHGRRPNA
jgi:glycosyltransferase involved in cell wall biosynthesis